MKKLVLLILLLSGQAFASYSPGVFIADPTTPGNQAKVTSSTPIAGDKALVCSLHPNSAPVSISGTVPVSGTFWQATQPVSIADGSAITTGSKADAAATDSTSSWSVVAILKGVYAKIVALSGQLPAALDGSGFLKIHEQGTVATKAAVNATASASQNSITTTASTITAPANAVGFQISNDSASTDCVRYRIGGTASSSAGIQLFPTDVTPEIHSGSNISIAACSGTQTVNVQWISQ